MKLDLTPIKDRLAELEDDSCIRALFEVQHIKDLINAVDSLYESETYWKNTANASLKGMERYEKRLLKSESIIKELKEGKQG